jgi:hypothetical protein
MSARILRFQFSVSIGLSVFAFALLVVFGEKRIPGGPFVSFRGDILPHFFVLAAVIFALVDYSSRSTRHRVFSILTAGLALTVSTLVALSTWSFFHEPYARGRLFAW